MKIVLKVPFQPCSSAEPTFMPTLNTCECGYKSCDITSTLARGWSRSARSRNRVDLQVKCDKMENKGERRRQTCPHCSQNLSYSAFLAHKARYFNEVSLQWTILDSSGSTKRPLAGNFPIANDAQDSQQTSLNEMMMESAI